MAVYDGLRHLGPVHGGIRSCGIIACATIDRRTCTDRSSVLKPASFESIQITATFPIVDNAFYFPTTLQASLTPVLNYLYCNEDVNSKETKIEMETIFDEKNLLSFGFYGRVCSRDFLVRNSYEKLSGDDWMKIFIAAAAAAVIASVIFIFYAQRSDLKLKIS